MKVHDKGIKGDRDRAVLIRSYKAMCKDFKIPAKRCLNDVDLARLSNKMIYRISADLYSQATVKQANKLAIKMGLVKKPESWVNKIITFLKKVQYGRNK